MIKCSNLKCENLARYTIIKTKKSYCEECIVKILKRCVMCGDLATFIAIETKEYLCEKCNKTNNQIRYGKGLPPQLNSVVEQINEEE